MFSYTVRLFQQFDSEQPVMVSRHNYRPYAESQADIWKRLYPGMHVAIEENENESS